MQHGRDLLVGVSRTGPLSGIFYFKFHLFFVDIGKYLMSMYLPCSLKPCGDYEFQYFGWEWVEFGGAGGVSCFFIF